MIETYAWLAIITLAQAVLIALKIVERRNGRKNRTRDNPRIYPCQEHSNRLTKLETMIENNREDIRDIKGMLKG